MEATVWKRLAVLVVVGLIPASAVAHTRLFYRESYRSDYRKVEVTSTPEPMLTVEPTVPHLVEIPLEPTLTLEPALTPIPNEIPTPTPSVEIIDTDDVVDITDQITSSTDLSTTPSEEDF